MNICVIGTGYVGLVTGACFADFGNSVICIDKDIKRIKSLKKGEMPFYEPALPEMVQKNYQAKRLSFGWNSVRAINDSEIIFITVGTPPKQNGEVDVSAMTEVANGIAAVLKRKKKASKYFKVIVIKSTVPVGIGDYVAKILKENGVPEKSFSVVSNPEFLREGSAISDFLHPDRIIIGASNNRAFNLVAELYRPLNAHVIFTDVKNAELIKYVSNAFLATKISFINEIANICDRVKTDVNLIADAIGLDKRIGRAFLNAGLGYGGSCLPKDVLALIQLARSAGYEANLLSSVHKLNQAQAAYFAEKISKTLKGVKGKKLAVLGLAFKPGTDDLREAPALRLISELLKQGAKVAAYDPVAEGNAKKILPEVAFCQNLYDALKGSDAVIVATEWPEFMELDFSYARKLVKKAILFDGRNIYDSKQITEAGFRYVGIGR